MRKAIMIGITLFLISSVCLFAQSEKPSVPANGNSRKEAGKNAISTAQDFNTTRSNRQNSNYNHKIVINVGGNRTIDKDQDGLREGKADNKEYTDEWSTAVIVVNPTPNDSSSTDNPHAISTAQDFNTVRSNRQNSNYNHKIVINVGGNRTIDKEQDRLQAGKADSKAYTGEQSTTVIVLNTNPDDSSSTDNPHAISTAQDFNTVRSNRQNSNFVINNNNGNTIRVNYKPAGGRTLPEALAEDDDAIWEWDDSNEGTVLNPLFEGMMKGNIKEKNIHLGDMATIIIRNNAPGVQSNAIHENPLYQAGGRPGENPLYESSKLRKRNASSANNRCISFSVGGGFSNGTGSHAGSGFHGGADMQKGIFNNVRLSAGINYSSLTFRYKGSPDLSDEYIAGMGNSISSSGWHLTTINVGPVIRLGRNKLNADLFGKIGATFVKIPNQFVGIPGSSGRVDDESGVARFSGNKTAVSLQTGIQINYAVSKRIDLFLSPHFFTTLGKNIAYMEKDASRALQDGKTFDYKTFMNLPYEKKAESIQMLNLSAGMSISFCKK